MKLDCYLISISVFVVYCLVVYFRFGMHRSISDTYNTLRKYKLFCIFDRGVFFHLFIFGISIPIIIASNNSSWFLTLSGLLISLVGFTANTKNTEVREQLHVFGATGGIIAGAIAMIEQIIRNILADKTNWSSELFGTPFLYSMLLLIGVTIYIYKKPVKHTTTWEEIAAYLLIILPFLVYEL